MHHFMRRGMALLLLIAMLLSVLPTAFAQEAEQTEITTEAVVGANDVLSTSATAQTHNVTNSAKEINAYWLNPSNFTISNTNIDRLIARGVTDIYVLAKGELGTLNTTDITNVISHAGTSARVHAWVVCARDDSFLKSNPTAATVHFRFGQKNNAHDSSSSYYADRIGYVDLRNTNYIDHMNTNIIDKLEAISGLDGIHLDYVRYGAEYYGWDTGLRNALGKADHNTLVEALCKHHGYTYKTDSSGYYVFNSKVEGSDDLTSMATAINSNSTAAQKFIAYRTETVTNFVKAIKSKLKSGLILSASVMPEVVDSNYGLSLYGQDVSELKDYLDYVVTMTYFGDYYAYNGNTYDTAWPANNAKKIANKGCNVVVGLQGYDFVNDSTKNGCAPNGDEVQDQLEKIHDARFEINGKPDVGGDILGSAVFRAGTSAQALITYNPTDKVVTFDIVNGSTKSLAWRINLESGFYVDKSRCTVNTSNETYSFTYDGTTYTYYYGGTAKNNYYPRLGYYDEIAAYGTKKIVVPVCTSSGGAVSTSYNNNYFSELLIYSATNREDSTVLPLYQKAYINSGHKSCSFTKTTPVAATCTTAGYNLYTCKTCGYDYTETIATGGHDYTTTTTPATCTQSGSTVKTCKNCGDVQTETLAALGHNYSSVVTPPTCSDDGYTTNTCSTCGDVTITDPVASSGHNYEAVVVPPTCSSQGYTIYTCSKCSDSYKENIVSALEHPYEQVVTPPTCTESGYSTYTCVSCGDVYIGDTVAALGHDYGDGVVALEPSCSDEGVIIYTCAVCGESHRDVIPTSGHTYSVVVTAPTCLTGGYTTYTCNDCGYSYVGDEVKKLGHNHKAVVTPPTCFDRGYTTYTCINEGCNDTYVSNYVAATGHNYDINVVAPTCTEVGYTEFVCICGDSFISDYVSAAGHSFKYTDNGDHHIVSCENCDYYATDNHNLVNFTCTDCNAFLCTHESTRVVVDVPATCTTTGSQKTLCDQCGNTLSTETISATGHNVQYTAAKKATCDEPGNRAYWKCGNCSLCFTDQSCSYPLPDAYITIAPTGHNYTVTTVTANCTTAGYTKYDCSACGDSYVTDEVAAYGHNYQKLSMGATCTQDGYDRYICPNCGDSYTVTTEAAFGHCYAYENLGDNHRVSCEDCSYSEITGHSFVSGLCACGAEGSTEPKYEYNSNLGMTMNISVGAEMQVMYTVLNARVKSYESFYIEVVKDVVGGESVKTVFSLNDGNMVEMFAPNGNLVGYTATYTGIFAMEMGDNFTATLYAVAEDGTIYYGDSESASIKTYLMEKLADSTSTAELKTLAVDMLNYGAAAQVNFNYDADNLVNADLTAAQKALGTQGVVAATDSSATAGNGGRITTSVSLQSKVLLYVNCNYAKTENSNLEFVVKNLNGDVLERFAPTIAAAKICQGVYGNVGARQMRDLITIELYDNGVLVSQTLTWNIESYVAQTRANSASSEALIATVNAMLAYGDSAAVYLTASGQ